MRKRVDKLTKEELRYLVAVYVIPGFNVNILKYVWDTKDRRHPPLPHYPDDWNAVQEVEAAVEKRKCELKYVQILYSLCAPKYLKKGIRNWATPDIWVCLRATPEQRCRAALKTIIGEWVKFPEFT